MSIDTAAKRLAAIDFCMSLAASMPAPDGGFSLGDLYHLIGLYPLGSTPPVVRDTHDGFGRHGDRHLDEVRKQLKRAEEARDRTIQERKAAAKQLRKALERAYYGIEEEAPELAAQFAEIAPRTVKVDTAKFLPAVSTIDWAAFATDLDRVGRLINEMESQRLEAMAADEDDIAILLIAAL